MLTRFRALGIDEKRFLFVCGALWSLLHLTATALLLFTGYPDMLGGFLFADAIGAVAIGLCWLARRLPALGRIPTVPPADVTRYGAILHEAAHGGDRSFCRPVVCRQFETYARVLLAALAADGRLADTPGPAS